MRSNRDPYADCLPVPRLKAKQARLAVVVRYGSPESLSLSEESRIPEWGISSGISVSTHAMSSLTRRIKPDCRQQISIDLGYRPGSEIRMSPFLAGRGLIASRGTVDG